MRPDSLRKRNTAFIDEKSKFLLLLHRPFTFLMFCCTLFLLFPSPAVSSNQSNDLELLRRENAVSEKMRSQIEQVLLTYYKRETFLVNVRAFLEPLATEVPQKQQKTTDYDEVELPGLPIQPSLISPQDSQQYEIEKWAFSDKFAIKYIDVALLLDETAFSIKDVDFAKTVVQSRIGFDDVRGDLITVKSMAFPPPIDIIKSYSRAAPPPEPKETEKLQATLKEIYPYIYFGGTILALLLFVIIILQVIGLMRPKAALNPYAYQLPSRNNHYADGGESVKHQLSTGDELSVTHRPSQSGRTEAPSSESLPPGDKDMFYELRQLIIITIIGNPRISGEVLKRWVELQQDGGIYQISGFLKATDPGLIELLADPMGNEITSKVRFAMNQMTSIDKESIIETLKKFREEYQKAQSIYAQRSAQSDIFDFLKQLSPEQLYHVIKDEPVGIMAIALAQISPEHASAVFNQLPTDAQSKIPVEIGKLKKIPVTTYQDIADKLAQKARVAGKIKFISTDGVEALGNILEQAPPDKEQEMIASITLHDIQLADELRKVYITFDELPLLPDKTLSEILRSIDRDIITKSLIDTDPSLREKILDNLPQRMKLMISDEIQRIEESGEVPVDEAHKARRIITQKVREMAKNGLIDLTKLRHS